MEDAVHRDEELRRALGKAGKIVIAQVRQGEEEGPGIDDPAARRGVRFGPVNDAPRLKLLQPEPREASREGHPRPTRRKHKARACHPAS